MNRSNSNHQGRECLVCSKYFSDQTVSVVNSSNGLKTLCDKCASTIQKHPTSPLSQIESKEETFVNIKGMSPGVKIMKFTLKYRSNCVECNKLLDLGAVVLAQKLENWLFHCYPKCNERDLLNFKASNNNNTSAILQNQLGRNEVKVIESPLLEDHSKSRGKQTEHIVVLDISKEDEEEENIQPIKRRKVDTLAATKIISKETSRKTKVVTAPPTYDPYDQSDDYEKDSFLASEDASAEEEEENSEESFRNNDQDENDDVEEVYSDKEYRIEKKKKKNSNTEAKKKTKKKKSSLLQTLYDEMSDESVEEPSTANSDEIEVQEELPDEEKEDDDDEDGSDSQEEVYRKLFCYICRRHYVLDDFSSLQKKEQYGRYCLRHTSTSGFNRSYSLPDRAAKGLRLVPSATSPVAAVSTADVNHRLLHTSHTTSTSHSLKKHSTSSSSVTKKSTIVSNSSKYNLHLDAIGDDNDDDNDDDDEDDDDDEEFDGTSASKVTSTKQVASTLHQSSRPNQSSSDMLLMSPHADSKSVSPMRQKLQSAKSTRQPMKINIRDDSYFQVNDKNDDDVLVNLMNSDLKSRKDKNHGRRSQKQHSKQKSSSKHKTETSRPRRQAAANAMVVLRASKVYTSDDDEEEKDKKSMEEDGSEYDEDEDDNHAELDDDADAQSDNPTEDEESFDHYPRRSTPSRSAKKQANYRKIYMSSDEEFGNDHNEPRRKSPKRQRQPSASSSRRTVSRLKYDEEEEEDEEEPLAKTVDNDEEDEELYFSISKNDPIYSKEKEAISRKIVSKIRIDEDEEI
jgi:hypothetical protein